MLIEKRFKFSLLRCDIFHADFLYTVSNIMASFVLYNLIMVPPSYFLNSRTLYFYITIQNTFNLLIKRTKSYGPNVFTV